MRACATRRTERFVPFAPTFRPDGYLPFPLLSLCRKRIDLVIENPLLGCPASSRAIVFPHMSDTCHPDALPIGRRGQDCAYRRRQPIRPLPGRSRRKLRCPPGGCREIGINSDFLELNLSDRQATSWSASTAAIYRARQITY